MKGVLKLLILLIVFVLVFVLMVKCKDKDINISDKIIKTIDNKSNQTNNCIILMKEITNFKWDKMVIFEVGSSNSEISKALGLEYKDSTDLMSGIVFVCDNKIIYKENIPYYPEHPSKLQYHVGNSPGEPNCVLMFPNNAIFKGNREQIDGVFYYEIMPVDCKNYTD